MFIYSEGKSHCRLTAHLAHIEILIPTPVPHVPKVYEGWKSLPLLSKVSTVYDPLITLVVLGSLTENLCG